jgi:hypothetical protein
MLSADITKKYLNICKKYKYSQIEYIIKNFNGINASDNEKIIMEVNKESVNLPLIYYQTYHNLTGGKKSKKNKKHKKHKTINGHIKKKSKSGSKSSSKSKSGSKSRRTHIKKQIDESNKNSNINDFSENTTPSKKSFLGNIKKLHKNAKTHINTAKKHIDSINDTETNNDSDFDGIAPPKGTLVDVIKSGKIIYDKLLKKNTNIESNSTNSENSSEISDYSENSNTSSDCEYVKPEKINLNLNDIFALNTKIIHSVKNFNWLIEQLMEMKNLDVDIIKLNRGIDEISRIQREISIILGKNPP